MSATDELRRMLDERGVEWKCYTDMTRGAMELFHSTYFDTPNGKVRVASTIGSDLVFVTFKTTTVQAIEATLGRGTCYVVKSEFDELDEYPHTWLSCGHHTMLLPSEMQFCPKCGARILEPHSNLLGEVER